MRFLEAAREELARVRAYGGEGVGEDFTRRRLEGLRAFNGNFVKGCFDPDHFISLSNIERLMTRPLSRQKSLARRSAWDKSDWLGKKKSEKALIEKK